MKPSRYRYQVKKGIIKPKESALLSRSEGGKRYQYDNRIANKFAGWSTVQRDKGITPLFADFYNELPPFDQEQITVTEIFKDETSKTK